MVSESGAIGYIHSSLLKPLIECLSKTASVPAIEQLIQILMQKLQAQFWQDFPEFGKLLASIPTPESDKNGDPEIVSFSFGVLRCLNKSSLIDDLFGLFPKLVQFCEYEDASWHQKVLN